MISVGIVWSVFSFMNIFDRCIPSIDIADSTVRVSSVMFFIGLNWVYHKNVRTSSVAVSVEYLFMFSNICL